METRFVIMHFAQHWLTCHGWLWLNNTGRATLVDIVGRVLSSDGVLSAVEIWLHEWCAVECGVVLRLDELFDYISYQL